MRNDLRRFIANARWFGGKDRDFTVSGVRRAGTFPLGEEGPGVAVDLVEVSFTEGDTDLYQLPLSLRDEKDDRLEHAFIGTWDDPDFGRSHVYDAVHDREAMGQLLDTFSSLDDEHPVEPSGLIFHRLPGHQLDTSARSTLFAGEQSNSSVAFGEDSMLKLFRKVTPGVNPDVEIHAALTRSTDEHVAALYGWIEIDDGPGSVIQLGMLQQFLRTASDGWELAQASVRNLYAEADLHAEEVGGDFAGESHRLGEALAQIHGVLAEAFPVGARTPTDMAALARTMHARLRSAIDVVPELADHAARIGAIFDAVSGFDEVAIQRIHGDLHLGQTLRTVRGWKIVDFEGEPARPLLERRLPDSRWRDVAGMLRSFDYAAAVVGRIFAGSDDTGASQRSYRGHEWSARNRGAFVAAYAGRELTADEQLLLAAYEADKAVYECVYEARNRPSWLAIPLAGLAHLGHQPGATATR